MIQCVRVDLLNMQIGIFLKFIRLLYFFGLRWVFIAAHFFQGTEKLLEVWFSRQQPDANQGSGDLGTIPRSEWDILLKDVQCSIISVTKTDKQEAYVLR